MADIVNLRTHVTAIAQSTLEAQQAAVKIIYDGPEGKILQPENKFAAAKLAQGTGWPFENPVSDSFERDGKPLVVFIPKPSEVSIVSKFKDSAILVYRQKFDAEILAEETKYKKTEKYYAGNRSASIKGPFKRCVAPFISLPGLKAVPQHDYYAAEFGKRKLPRNLLKLVLAASLKDPKKGEYLFENLPLRLQWVPEKYRTVSICLGAMRRAEKLHSGNKFDVFHYIPEAVRQDREFQDAMMKEFNNAWIKWYVTVETAKHPRTLVQIRPGNQDMGIDNSFTLKDGIK